MAPPRPDTKGAGEILLTTVNFLHVRAQLVYHLSVLTFHAFPAWGGFVEWFLTLPLS